MPGEVTPGEHAKKEKATPLPPPRSSRKDKPGWMRFLNGCIEKKILK